MSIPIIPDSASAAPVTWLIVAFSWGGGVARYLLYLFISIASSPGSVSVCTLQPGYLDSGTTTQTLSTHRRPHWTRTPDNRESLFWALLASDCSRRVSLHHLLIAPWEVGAVQQPAASSQQTADNDARVMFSLVMLWSSNQQQLLSLATRAWDETMG